MGNFAESIQIMFLPIMCIILFILLCILRASQQEIYMYVVACLSLVTVLAYLLASSFNCLGQITG